MAEKHLFYGFATAAALHKAMPHSKALHTGNTASLQRCDFFSMQFGAVSRHVKANNTENTPISAEKQAFPC